MGNPYFDEDAAANLLERRWFAAFKAASSVRAECEVLVDAIARAQASWNQARARLHEIETMRDALGDELEALEDRSDRALVVRSDSVMTAA